MKTIVLITILSALCNPIVFADEMPSEVKRLTVLRNKKVQDIDTRYWQDLNKLKTKYAKSGNIKGALYIEKMQIEYLDKNKAKLAPTTVVLLPEDADIKGKDTRIDDGCIQWWNCEENISFDIPDLCEGSYSVSIKYAAGRIYGTTLSISINNKTYKEEFPKTGSWQNTTEKLINGYEHDGGRVKINFSVLENAGREHANLNLYSITFKKI